MSGFKRPGSRTPLAGPAAGRRATAPARLAVAYEHEGQLAKARDAYEKALALEPNNALVRQNYDLFKEINDRAAQKDGR